MLRHRSFFTIVLILFATLLVSCGGSVAKEPTTYTAEKIAEIQAAIVPITTARERLPELEELIIQKDWIDVDNFIHGPMGQLRQSMGYISLQLLKRDQPSAKETAEDVFDDLENIDVAAKNRNPSAALSNYDKAVKDFDNFLDLIPSES